MSIWIAVLCLRINSCGRLCPAVGAHLRGRTGCDGTDAFRRDCCSPRGRREVTQTDSEGRFDFQDISEGKYELTASLNGFAPAWHVVQLTPAQHLTVSLTLTVLLLEQVVVTAERAGETDVQTTPMAVSVLSGSQLTRMQDHNVEHIVARAPAVTCSQNTGLAQLTIRGIGSNTVFAGTDPSSAVYLDGVYLARPAMIRPSAVVHNRKRATAREPRRPSRRC